MNNKYLFYEGGEIFEDYPPDRYVADALRKYSYMHFDTRCEIDDSIDNIFYIQNHVEGIEVKYSIRFGCFHRYKDGSLTLENTFYSIADMFEDMLRFCFEELSDLTYLPYTEIEKRNKSDYM